MLHCKLWIISHPPLQNINLIKKKPSTSDIHRPALISIPITDLKNNGGSAHLSRSLVIR